MASLSTAWKLLRDLGPTWVFRRIKFKAQPQLGILRRRIPASDWEFDSRDWLRPDAALEGKNFKQYLRSGFRFFFASENLPRPHNPVDVSKQADRVLAGEWSYFFHSCFKMGFPPDWHANVLDGTRVDDHCHWSEIDLDSIRDVKFVWEPSRFSVVYLLVRAYAVSREERYAEGFWRLIEDWAEHNPPNHGVNWASGQEAAVRVIAWCFGLYAFLDSASSTAERVFRLVRMIEKHGERIAGFIEYALSQKNNHGIIEAVGLFTIGTLFPQMERSATWLETGRDLIVQQLREQFYADGSYIQHSFNYERVAIDALLWAFRLAELNGRPFPEGSCQALRRAVDFMLHFCDPNTGRMPNYGGNDGASILPLSSCEYIDFRPSLQALHYLSYGRPCFPEGEWDEMWQWLIGSEMESLKSRTDAGSRDPTPVCSGYLRLVARESWAMLRAARYPDRPAQADQLHFDLWWRGENIACDAGTYLYNGSKPWTNRLAATSVHNTVTVAGHDQMTRAGRFLWLDWAQAESGSYRLGADCEAVEAWHDGYQKSGVMHKRSVLNVHCMDCWVVVDDILGTSPVSARLHWLLPDYQFAWEESARRLRLQTPAGPFQCCLTLPGACALSVVRGGELLAGAEMGCAADRETRGWRSLYYGEKVPGLSLAAETRVPSRFITVLGPSEVLIEVDQRAVKLQSPGREYSVGLRAPGSGRVFSEI